MIEFFLSSILYLQITIFYSLSSIVQLYIVFIAESIKKGDKTRNQGVNSTPTFTAIGENNSKRSMDKHSPIWILTENEKKQRKKDNDMKKSWLPITLGVVLALVLGLALLGKMPTPFASKEATPAQFHCYA